MKTSKMKKSARPKSKKQKSRRNKLDPTPKQEEGKLSHIFIRFCLAFALLYIDFFGIETSIDSTSATGFKKLASAQHPLDHREDITVIVFRESDLPWSIFGYNRDQVWPLPHRHLNQLLKPLIDAKPAAIFFDVYFSQRADINPEKLSTCFEDAACKQQQLSKVQECDDSLENSEKPEPHPINSQACKDAYYIQLLTTLEEARSENIPIYLGSPGTGPAHASDNPDRLLQAHASGTLIAGWTQVKGRYPFLVSNSTGDAVGNNFTRHSPEILPWLSADKIQNLDGQAKYLPTPASVLYRDWLISRRPPQHQPPHKLEEFFIGMNTLHNPKELDHITLPFGPPISIMWGLEPSFSYSRDTIQNQNCPNYYAKPYVQFAGINWNWLFHILFKASSGNKSGEDKWVRLTHCFFLNEYSATDYFAQTSQGPLSQDFTDNIILIGADLSASRDIHTSPLHGPIPGVHLHATALHNLMVYGNNYWTEAPNFMGISFSIWVETSFLLALALLRFFCCSPTEVKRLFGRKRLISPQAFLVASLLLLATYFFTFTLWMRWIPDDWLTMIFVWLIMCFPDPRVISPRLFATKAKLATLMNISPSHTPTKKRQNHRTQN